MKINVSKTKFMVFNTCKNMDFLPTTIIDGEQINLVEEMKILGVIISSDLKFTKNTEYIVKRAFKRIRILRRLKNLGANQSQLLDI